MLFGFVDRSRSGLILLCLVVGEKIRFTGKTLSIVVDALALSLFLPLQFSFSVLSLSSCGICF